MTDKEKADRAYAKKKRATPWHEWYAWYPVRLKDGRWFWLETVHRRARVVQGNYGGEDLLYYYKDRNQCLLSACSEE
jgi:hypothetical protein